MKEVDNNIRIPLRPIKSLLILLRDEMSSTENKVITIEYAVIKYLFIKIPQEKCRKYLCWCLESLYHQNIISYEEALKLHSYIINHRPKRGKFYHPMYEDDVYFWKPNNKEIRIQWLNYRISKERY